MGAELGLGSITQKRLNRERCAFLPDIFRGGFLLLFGVGVPVLFGGYLISRAMSPFFWILLAAFLTLAVYGAYIIGRTISYFPAGRSEFGRSALTQTAGLQTLWELLDEIDEDIRRGAARFGPVVIGRTWFVGEGAMRLSRVCGVFSITVARVSHALCLVDFNGNIQVTSIFKVAQMHDAAAFLRTRLPGARFGESMEDYQAFLRMKPAERRRFAPPRAAAIVRTVPARVSGPFTLQKAGRAPVHGCSLQDLLREIDGLGRTGEMVGIALSNPAPLWEYGAVSALYVQRTQSPDQSRLIVAYHEMGLVHQAARVVDAAQARDAAEALYTRGLLPPFTEWIETGDPPGNADQRYVLRVDGQPVPCGALRDVDTALERLTDGSCKSFSLMLPDRSTGGMFFRRRRRRYAAEAAVPAKNGRIRWYTTSTQRQDQIRLWAHSYYTHSQFPFLSGWEETVQHVELFRPRARKKAGRV